MAMDLQDALDIVYDLASENMIDFREADGDEVLMGEHMQMDASSTDCHDHNMTDCEACALHCALKKDIEISELFMTPNLYTDYSVPVVTLVLPSDIRPPIS